MRWLIGAALVMAATHGWGETVVLRSGLVKSVPRGARSPVHLDPVELDLITGGWRHPLAGLDGWRPIDANKDGWFEDNALGSGYVRLEVNSDRRKVAFLEEEGASVAYVNGVPRAGDPYSFGYASLPIELEAGRNELLMLCGRGRLRVRIVDVERPVSFDLRDLTVPDVAIANGRDALAGVVIRNATTSPLTGGSVLAAGAGRAIKTNLPQIPPMTIRKVAIRLPLGGDEKVKLRLTHGNLSDSGEIGLRVRKATEPYRRTFVSAIDGSVQYYGVNPSSQPSPGQALFLSLHGASVEGIGQAEAYSSKSWGTLIAPTNRRPYGFDWEDIGRRDGIEVLDDATSWLHPDPTKVYLTGHSMGGHGTWQFGVTYPNRFSAIAPSAGWISFGTYGGVARYSNPGPVEKMLLRAGNPSDTFGLRTNLASTGVYIVHGDADDNVPVTEARTMRDALKPFVSDFGYHEEPGAGHWWDKSDAPGADCVDWSGIFEMFARRHLVPMSQVKSVDFMTANPGINATRDWVTIEQQTHPLEFSRVRIAAAADGSGFEGTTENVARLSLSTAPLSGEREVRVRLDGETLSVPRRRSRAIHLLRTSAGWKFAGPARGDQKGPERNGGFKDVFRNRVVFVYGTKGTAEENEWARNKARFDAETLWYRGNGAVDVVADVDFQPNRDRDRNVLIYGSETSNAAWPALLGKSPIRIRSGTVSIGSKKVAGNDLAVLFIRPRPGSRAASVAAISGSGPVGRRLAERIPIFLSGAALPDVFVLSSEALTKGTAGVRAAGFFGNNWGVDTGEFAFGPQ